MSYFQEPDRFTYNLAGQVRHQGLPVANLKVVIFDQYQVLGSGQEEPFAETLTGARGEFSFSLRPGFYSIKALPDIQSGTRFLEKVLPDIRVLGNSSVNISLSTGFVIRGRVKLPQESEGEDDLRSALFSGMELVALGIEPSAYKVNVPLSPQGEFALVVPKGKYHIALKGRSAQAKASGSANSNSNNSHPRFNFLSTGSDVLLVQDDEDITITLPGLTGFGGVVSDGTGEAIVGARVTLTPSMVRTATPCTEGLLLSELDLKTQAVTAEEGRFQFAVEPGFYDLLIEAPETSNCFSYKEHDIEVVESEGGTALRQYRLSKGNLLRGQVSYETRLLSQALVRAFSLDKKDGGDYFTRTNEDGQFMLSLPRGSYRVTISAHPKDSPTLSVGGIEYASLAPWTRTFEIDGENQLNCKLADGTAVFGKISDDAGQSRPGVKVAVYEDLQGEAIALATTDSEGRYGLFLSPGKYHLVVHRDFSQAREIEIESEPCEINIVWHGWSQIVFHLVGEDGQAVPRCRVLYAPYGDDYVESGQEKPGGKSAAVDYPHGFVLTQDDGSCKLTLPSGVYSFRFVPPQAGSYEPKSIRQLSISADVAKKITLELKRS